MSPRFDVTLRVQPRGKFQHEADLTIRVFCSNTYDAIARATITARNKYGVDVFRVVRCVEGE